MDSYEQLEHEIARLSTALERIAHDATLTALDMAALAREALK